MATAYYPKNGSYVAWTPDMVGAAAASHTHTKSQITDFPKSMPASDVYAWAKASSKPSYSWEEITSKPSTFTPSAHTHDYITVSTTQPTSSTCKIWIKA